MGIVDREAEIQSARRYARALELQVRPSPEAEALLGPDAVRAVLICAPVRHSLLVRPPTTPTSSPKVRVARYSHSIGNGIAAIQTYLDMDTELKTCRDGQTTEVGKFIDGLLERGEARGVHTPDLGLQVCGAESAPGGILN